ncbi:hypothetical protein Moror_14337 [Moniliophthora roreri MCA 2997]|uniref:Uncharacterized protein n=1 Tax=Moniliophthora roreri (strain MCA 2997) TaxID=1381753 RepID=V2X653_MONRO|nr:hypothetical protein Moror_14337 [Moniliophthora roreri MCA 2997]
MYNGYASPGPTNNPFSSDPSSAYNRFPNIDTSPSPPNPQFTSWMQPGSGSGFQSPQPQQQQQQQYQQYNPQFNPGGYSMQNMGGQQWGMQSPISQPTGFQPTSNFGQQLASQANGSSYGYLNGQQQQQQQQHYNPAQQQLASPGYLSQFDPYASIGQGWDGSSQIVQQTPQQIQSPMSPTSGSGFTGTTTSRSVTGEAHPREYIRTHKAEIESWDSYAWKQLLDSFDALKDAWQTRKKELEGKVSQLQLQIQYSGGGYYTVQIQQEAARLQSLTKEADNNFDSIAASSFQMREVFENYRQSGDMASKRRVKEASNAALQSLPGWPPQIY